MISNNYFTGLKKKENLISMSATGLNATRDYQMYIYKQLFSMFYSSILGMEL